MSEWNGNSFDFTSTIERKNMLEKIKAKRFCYERNNYLSDRFNLHFIHLSALLNNFHNICNSTFLRYVRVILSVLSYNERRTRSQGY